MVRDEITDAQWEHLQPLLPPQKPKTGRPNKDHRTVLSGIVWILRTGAPWRDLPERFGSPKTVSSRFYRWRKAGIWQRILARLHQVRDREGRLDWVEHFVDGTVVRAHQHAAGAKGGTPRRRPWAAAVAASVQKSTCASSAGASCSSSS
jgi:transposase